MSKQDKNGVTFNPGDYVKVLCKVTSTSRSMPGEVEPTDIYVEVVGNNGVGEVTEIALHSSQVEADFANG